MTGFELGQIVITFGIDTACEDSKAFEKEVYNALDRYAVGDWGDLDPEDWMANDEAVMSGRQTGPIFDHYDSEIVAKYKTSKGDVFIITEWDRSRTTILFPDEY